MPTVKSKGGRAQHVLFAKQCGLCNCVTDTYRCNPKCCPREEIDNGRFTIDDVRKMFCQIIFNRLTRTQSDINTLTNELCSFNYPSFDCPISISILQEGGLEILLTTILNGSCTAESVTASIVENVDYILLIDDIECVTIQFS